MGYQIGVNVNAMKASDFTNVGGVKVTVFLETENFSVMTMTTDSNGHAYDNLDRSQYAATEIARVQAYFEKDGYLKGCILLPSDASFVDGNGVKHHVLSGEPMLLTAPAEILPPPDMEENQPPVILPPVGPPFAP